MSTARERSGAFYGALLGRQPVETSPTFALFVLDNGFKLGLWSRHTVEPRPRPRAAVRSLSSQWTA